MGLFIGEMWDLDALAADCAADGVYEFFLTAAPLPDHRRGRLPRQPDRRQVAAGGTRCQQSDNVLVVGGRPGRRRHRHPASPPPGSPST